MTEGYEPFGSATISEIKRKAAVAAVAVALAQSVEPKRQAVAVAVATALLLEAPSPVQTAGRPSSFILHPVGPLPSAWQIVMRFQPTCEEITRFTTMKLNVKVNNLSYEVEIQDLMPAP